MKLALALVLCQVLVGAAFDYEVVDAGNIILTDVETQISPIVTLFLDEPVDVTVDGIGWASNTNTTDGETSLTYETFVNGKIQASGTFDLSDVGRELPGSIPAGQVKVSSNGRHYIEVKLTLDGKTESTSDSYVAYKAGVSIFPLIVVLLFAVTTRMVEFSLFSAIFVGACMVSGNVKDGFKMTLDNFILNALSNVDHGYVYLFTLFLSGLVGMLERSGGSKCLLIC
jgi:hypothetical protein